MNTSKLNPTLIFFVCLVALACSSVEHGATVRTTDIYGPGVIQMPVVAEMDVDINQIEGNANSSSGKSIESLKNVAIKNALNDNEADVLVDPTFEVEEDGRRKEVTVTGYPANYTDFRSIKQEDLPLLEAGELQVVATREARSEEENGNNTAVILGVLGGLAVTGILITN